MCKCVNIYHCVHFVKRRFKDKKTGNRVFFYRERNMDHLSNFRETMSSLRSTNRSTLLYFKILSDQRDLWLSSI